MLPLRLRKPSVTAQMGFGKCAFSPMQSSCPRAVCHVTIWHIYHRWLQPSYHNMEHSSWSIYHRWLNGCNQAVTVWYIHHSRHCNQDVVPLPLYSQASMTRLPACRSSANAAQRAFHPGSNRARCGFPPRGAPRTRGPPTWSRVLLSCARHLWKAVAALLWPAPK